MTHNRLSHFYGACTILQIVHTRLIKVQVKWFKNKLQQQIKQKERRKEVYVKAWLKKGKSLELYGTLLAELRLEEEYNNHILLRMTSENFEEIFQLVKDNIPKENTNSR